MKPLAIPAALLASILVLPAHPAFAQVYKWVDARGVVNYGSQPPAEAVPASKVALVEDTVSVYSPDPQLVREMAAERERLKRAEEKPEPYRPAVAAIGGTAPAPQPAPAAEAEPVYVPYFVGGGFAHKRPRPMHKVPQVNLPAGAIAGATVGLNSIIPGSSAPVPGTWSPVAPQPVAHRPYPSKPWTRDDWRR